MEVPNFKTSCKINSLKGQLKLDPKLSAIAGEGKKGDGKSSKKKHLNRSLKRPNELKESVGDISERLIVKQRL